MIPPIGNRKVRLPLKYLTPFTSEDQGTTVSPAVCVVMFMMMRIIMINDYYDCCCHNHHHCDSMETA